MANTKDFKVKNGIQPTVYHEGVGTVVSGTNYFDLANAELLAETAALNGLNGNIDIVHSLLFTPDGTKLIVGAKDTLSASQPRTFLYEVDLNIAWDLSTFASISQEAQLTSQTSNAINGLAWNADGTKFFVGCNLLGGSIIEYSTSTAYSVASADVTYAGDSERLDTSTETGSGVHGIFFHDNGSKVIVATVTNDSLVEYSMSTPYDVSTGSHNQTKDVSADITNPHAMAFNTDGSELYVLDNANKIYTCSLTTPYDISTLSVGTATTIISIAEAAIFFKPDGSRLYTCTKTSPIDALREYNITTNTKTLDMSSGSVFEITPTSDIQVGLSNPAASGTVSQATLLLDGGINLSYNITNASHYGNMSISSELTSPEGMAISSDGTKIYATGRTTDKVFEYVLSTPWDVTTGSYNSVEFSVLSQTTYPTDIAFKSDGTKMYICTSAEDAVFQYSLSTAWDLSTASYDSVSFSTSSQENNVQALAFSNDGTKMYTAGLQYDNVVEYDLSTAWNVSTASYNSVTLSTSTQTTTPDGLFFNADGTSLYVISSDLDQVLRYDMTTAFDLSTASYINASSSLTGTANSGKGGRFDNTGTRMYIIDGNSVNVTQWTVGSDATITYPSTLEFEEGTAPTSPATGETDVITFSTRDGGTTYQAALSIDGAK